MLFSGDEPSMVDATTTDLIAERVRAALRRDLEALAAELLGASTPGVGDRLAGVVFV